MIVTCDECSTKFNFDNSLIKEKGSKVRCSVCQNIFTVYLPTENQQEPESDIAPSLAIQTEPTITNTDYKDSEIKPGFKKEWFDLVLDNAKCEVGVTHSNEWNKQTDEEIFLKEDFFADQKNEPDEEIFLREGLTPEEEEALLNQYYDKNSLNSKNSEDDGNKNENGESEENLQNIEKKNRKSVFGMFLLIVFIIFLLTAGTYVTGIVGGYNIPYLSDIRIPVVQDYIEKIFPKKQEAKPVLNDTIISDRFMTNTTTGTLFVITGQVDNTTEETFHYIELEAILSSGDGNASISKKVFCGNIIPDEMLRNGDITEIERLLNIREGKNNSNMNIQAHSSVPFMVVFFELPDKLKSYNIKIINFKELP